MIIDYKNIVKLLDAHVKDDEGIEAKSELYIKFPENEQNESKVSEFINKTIVAMSRDNVVEIIFDSNGYLIAIEIN